MKLKSGIRNGTGVTLKHLSNIVDETLMMKIIFHINYYKVIQKLYNPSANMNLSKTQLHKIGQSQGFLGIL